MSHPIPTTEDTLPEDLESELAERDLEAETCDGQCPNMTMTCPNVKPYADGSKRNAHTEVKCNKCGSLYLWGISWDGSKDGKFTCNRCYKLSYKQPQCNCNTRNGQPHFILCAVNQQ